MRVSAQAFCSPKAGNQESEYEDAFWPEGVITGQSGNSFRFAVADGATETSFSGIWAKQLVRAFGKGELGSERFQSCLETLRKRWHRVVSRKPMPWYAEEKVRSGAFAAIVGITLLDDNSGVNGAWTSAAIGDSCVVQTRGLRLVSCFPLATADQFSSTPELLGSSAADSAPDLLIANGTWCGGDTFYLMSDAIACWFLREVESGRAPVRHLRDLTDGTSRNFRSWLSDLRKTGAIRNDDVTVMRVEIEEGTE
jgi:hypothetical protein